MHQLGFRKGSSTELQTVKTLLKVEEMIERKPIYMVSFDIRGAFDHVSHIELVKIIRYVLETHQNQIMK